MLEHVLRCRSSGTSQIEKRSEQTLKYSVLPIER